MIPRVTFDDLFPHAVDDDEPVPGVFLANRTVPAACWVCGRETRWVSISFGAHVCSAICDDIGWNRYWIADAIAAGDPLWGRKNEAQDDHQCLQQVVGSGQG